MDCSVVVSDNTYLAGYAMPEGFFATLPGVAAVVVAGADADPSAARVDVPVFVGNTELAHLPGVAGLLCAEANVVPEIAAARDFDRLLALKRVCTRYGPRSLKAALAAIGRDAGTVRPPYLPLSPEEDAEIIQVFGPGVSSHETR